MGQSEQSGYNISVPMFEKHDSMHASYLLLLGIFYKLINDRVQKHIQYVNTNR